MAREPMRVGRDSTEPVDPITGLTPTETAWWAATAKHVGELNKLLEERGSEARYELRRVYP